MLTAASTHGSQAMQIDFESLGLGSVGTTAALVASYKFFPGIFDAMRRLAGISTEDKKAATEHDQVLFGGWKMLMDQLLASNIRMEAELVVARVERAEIRRAYESSTIREKEAIAREEKCVERFIKLEREIAQIRISTEPNG